MKFINKRVDGSVSGSVAGGRQPVMRRGNTLRESPTDHTADWEPLVLASVGPCRRGRMSSGATQS